MRNWTFKDNVGEDEDHQKLQKQKCADRHTNKQMDRRTDIKINTRSAYSLVSSIVHTLVQQRGNETEAESNED